MIDRSSTCDRINFKPSNEFEVFWPCDMARPNKSLTGNLDDTLSDVNEKSRLRASVARPPACSALKILNDSNHEIDES